MFKNIADHKESTQELMIDENFSHIFKKIESKYLMTSDDGEFVNMECETWLDLSQEVEMSGNEEPTW